MPPSQLKRLKQSLREQGLVRAPASESEKGVAGNGITKSSTQRHKRLNNIRDQFNPFEVKAVGLEKFAVMSNAPEQEQVSHRPGARKSLGEEKVNAEYTGV